MVFLFIRAPRDIRAGRNSGFTRFCGVRSLDVPQAYAVAHGHAKSSKNTLVTRSSLKSFVAPCSRDIRAGRNSGFTRFCGVRSLDVPQAYAVAHGHAKSSKNTLVTHSSLTSFVALCFRDLRAGRNGGFTRFCGVRSYDDTIYLLRVIQIERERSKSQQNAYRRAGSYGRRDDARRDFHGYGCAHRKRRYSHRNQAA